jgi:hypothetical protein
MASQRRRFAICCGPKSGRRAKNRGEETFVPDTRSFLDIVNGVGAPPRRMSAFAPRADRQFVARLRAFAFSRPWVVTLCVAVVGLCAAIYGAVGSIEEQSLAAVERKPALRAARATAAPRPTVARETVARAQDDDMTAPATPNKPRAEATPPSAAPDSDRTAPLIVALGPIGSQLTDARLPDPLTANVAAVPLSDVAARSDAYVARLWARMMTRDTEQQLDRLAVDYAALVNERDQLRERIKELEQTLSSLQVPSGSPQAARMPADGAVGGGSARPGAAVIAFPGAASAGPAAEPPRQALKNFTTPGSAPNYFSDESGAILGNRGAATQR